MRHTNIRTFYAKERAWREIRERAKELDLSASAYLVKLSRHEIHLVGPRYTEGQVPGWLRKIDEHLLENGDEA